MGGMDGAFYHRIPKDCRLERDLGSRLDGDPCLAGGNLLENVTLGSEKEDIKLHWSFFFLPLWSS